MYYILSEEDIKKLNNNELKPKDVMKLENIALNVSTGEDILYYMKKNNIKHIKPEDVIHIVYDKMLDLDCGLCIEEMVEYVIDSIEKDNGRKYE